MSKVLFNRIISDLCSYPLFSEFKYRKRDFTLIFKTKELQKSIEFQHWGTFGYPIFTVYPQYRVRFNVLHKWFENHSVKPINIQRDISSVGFDGRMLGHTDYFHFNENMQDYDREIEHFCREVIACSEYVFDNYGTLELLYKNKIVPILKGKSQLPIVGADWVFIYLKLCRLVAPESYDEFKRIVVNQIELMHEREEPNIALYYDRFPDIFSELESGEE